MGDEPDPRDMEWSVEMVKTSDGRLWIKTRREQDAEVTWEQYPEPIGSQMIGIFEAAGVV